uniref:B-cell receptor CD22 n=2 Tax=Kryptolebias marmoratus TaxID=37003 RepID=A0A3Q3BMI5_KRYMA
MFVLIWIILLYSVRATDANSGAPIWSTQHCQNLRSGYYCITLIDGNITAEAGLCVVIPCSFTTGYYFSPTNVVWFKCEATKKKCVDSDIIFHTTNFNKVQTTFKGRVSLLEPDLDQRNCSIIINDLQESDSGLYQLRVNGFLNYLSNGITFPSRSAVFVRGLSKKPSVVIPLLTEGQQTNLTCTAPGLCSGSRPEITWTWRGNGESSSQITENITDFHTEDLTPFTQRHSSTLTFNPSSEHHGTNITCKVSFTGGITTEETVMLNVSYVKEVKITGDTSVREGETLNLTCSVDSFPPSDVMWAKFGTENLLQNDSSTHLQEEQGISSVSISNVTLDVSGLYICTAKHGNKTLSKTVNITVPYKREPQIIGNLSLKEGDDLNLTCTAESFPPSVISWIRNSVRGIYLHNDTGSATLFISNVTAEDSGRYICTAEYQDETVTLHADVKVFWFSNILKGSGCVLQLNILTCVCISEGDPLPTIKWPLLEDRTEYSVLTSVSNNTINSTVSLTVENQENMSVECFSSNENGEANKRFTAEQDSITNKADQSKTIIDTVSRLEVIIAFLTGVLLSAIICCLGMKCYRMKQKNSGYLDETLEMRNSQEDPLIYERQAVQDNQTKDQDRSENGATASEKVFPEPNGGPNDVEYANIDFSKLKRRSARKAAKEQENTASEYAEIKIRVKEETKVSEEVKTLEGKEEELLMDDEEEIKDCVLEEQGGQVEAVYSTVKEALDEI